MPFARKWACFLVLCGGLNSLWGQSRLDGPLAEPACARLPDAVVPVLRGDHDRGLRRPGRHHPAPQRRGRRCVTDRVANRSGINKGASDLMPERIRDQPDRAQLHGGGGLLARNAAGGRNALRDCVDARRPVQHHRVVVRGRPCGVRALT